jgi:hypothetical protein
MIFYTQIKAVGIFGKKLNYYYLFGINNNSYTVWLTKLSKVEAPKGANDPFSPPRVALKPGSAHGRSGQEVREHGFRGPTAAMMRHAVPHVQCRSEQFGDFLQAASNSGCANFSIA